MTLTKKKNQVSVTKLNHVNIKANSVELFGGNAPSQESILTFESEALKFPQIEIETTNLIHSGMYARTIMIPAGVAVVGAAMNNDSVCISSGDITVTTDDGSVRLTGYHVISALSGKKRVGLAHQDTYWTSVFKSNANTVDEAEIEMTVEHEKLQTRMNLELPSEIMQGIL